jgi:hypothetical protein
MATTRRLDQITTLIIHCAATPNGRNHNAKDINYWHGHDRVAHGKTPFKRQRPAIENHASDLQHIGYHFVVRTNGTIDLGRHLIEVGAHCRGHNFESVGICLIGNDRFTPEQWYALRLLCKGLQYEIPSLEHIFGHTEVASYKTCPGFSVSDWLLCNMHALPKHTLDKQELNHD